jgi:hypothetical protein
MFPAAAQGWAVRPWKQHHSCVSIIPNSRGVRRLTWSASPCFLGYSKTIAHGQALYQPTTPQPCSCHEILGPKIRPYFLHLYIWSSTEAISIETFFFLCTNVLFTCALYIPFQAHELAIQYPVSLACFSSIIFLMPLLHKHSSHCVNPCRDPKACTRLLLCHGGMTGLELILLVSTKVSREYIYVT